MTRREVDWRLEMAAEKMKRRGIRVNSTGPVQRNPEFTEEEVRTLDTALIEAQERVKARFKR